MMNQMTKRIWGAALSMPSLSDLIEGFLDWIEQLSGAIAPASIDGLICNEVRTRVLLD
jgi:hypothetical protein